MTEFRKNPILDGAVAALQANAVIAAGDWTVVKARTDAESAEAIANYGNLILVRDGGAKKTSQGTCSTKVDMLISVMAIADNDEFGGLDGMETVCDIDDDIRSCLDGNTTIYHTSTAWVQQIDWIDISPTQTPWAGLYRDPEAPGFDMATVSFRVQIHQEND